MSLKRKLKRKGGAKKQEKAVQDAFQLFHNRRYREAIAACNNILVKFPRSGKAYQLLGHIALNQRQFDVAVSHFKTAVSLLPDSADTSCLLGISLREAGLFPEARNALHKSTQLAPDSFQGVYNLGILEFQSGKFKDAVHYLGMALKINPLHSRLVEMLADAYLMTRETGKAIETLEKYLLEKNVNLHQFFSGSTGDEPQLESPDPKLLAQAWNHADKQDVPVIVQLANLYQRSQKTVKSRFSAQLALHADPKNVRGNLTLAILDRQDGNLEKAAERIVQLEDISPRDEDLAAAITELGKIYDRQGRFEEAFSRFTTANNIMAALPSARVLDKSAMPLLAKHCTDYCVSKARGQRVSTLIQDSLPTPLFLVGFPRSGTTLTEHIIQNELNIHTSDELPVLHDMALQLPQLLSRQFIYPEDLETLTTEEVHFLRKHYWQEFQSTLNILPDNATTILDKLPLNILHLDLIEKIFPDAKVIVALRDPRDVCLSNYMQFFLLNNAMVNFLDLVDTGNFYAAVMNFWLAYRKRGGISWYETRYEDLVLSRKKTIEKIMQFITDQSGDLNNSQKNNTLQSSDTVYSTPSYFDVQQPMYTRAIGRWKNYENHLAPVIPQLNKFLVEFGYNNN